MVDHLGVEPGCAGAERLAIISLLIEGRLDVLADGQLDLPKQPPFDVLTAGPAVLVTVQLDSWSPDRIRLFDHWYLKGWALDVMAFDGERTAIRAAMRCVVITKEQGIQATRAWTAPERRQDALCALHRASPRFQRISRDVHRYVLAAQRYAFVAPPRPGSIEEAVLQ